MTIDRNSILARLLSFVLYQSFGLGLSFAGTLMPLVPVFIIVHFTGIVPLSYLILASLGMSMGDAANFARLAYEPSDDSNDASSILDMGPSLQLLFLALGFLRTVPVVLGFSALAVVAPPTLVGPILVLGPVAEYGVRSFKWYLSPLMWPAAMGVIIFHYRGLLTDVTPASISESGGMFLSSTPSSYTR